MRPSVSVLFLVASSLIAAPSWRPLGPFGGAAEAVVIDPGLQGRLLAATGNGLLFRSEDAGLNWRLLPFARELSGSVHALAVAPGNVTSYYVGIDHQGSCGAYRSTDAGETWRAMRDLCAVDVYALTVSRSNPDVLVAGCRDGVYLTVNGGDNWSRISPRENRELQPVMSVAIDPDNRTIYAGTPHLPWRTTDGGKTWRSIHNGMIDDSDVFSIEIDPRTPQKVYASACSGIYSSRDRGGVWAKALGLPRTSRRTYTIRVDPAAPSTLYAGTSRGLWKSADAGLHWRQVSPLVVKSIAFDPHDSKRLYLASEEGIATSTNGAETTEWVNSGFFHRQLSVLTPAPGGVFATVLSGFGSSGLFRYSRQEDRWEPLADATVPAGILSVALLDNGAMVASTNDRILRSTNGGRRWEPGPAPWKGARVQSMIALRGDPAVILVATTAGVYRTEDLGATWQSVAGAAVAADGVYAASGGAALLAQTQEGLFRSEDRGLTWSTVTMPVDRTSIYRVAVGPEDLVLAATTRGLYRSTDGARTWQPVNGPLGNGTVHDVILHPTRQEAFAVQLNAVYVSRDSGANWAPIAAPGLERCAVKSLAIAPDSPSDLYALTRSKGVFVLRGTFTEQADRPSVEEGSPKPVASEQ